MLASVGPISALCSTDLAPTFVRPGTYEVISEVISKLTQSLHNLSITYL